MGQRLVLSVKNNGEELLNVYYHWSGFTRCAMDIADEFMSTYKDTKTSVFGDKDLGLIPSLILSIHTLQQKNARLSVKAIDYLKSLEIESKNLPENFEIIETGIHRNSGVIELTPELMKEQYEVSEMYISCDLATEEFYFPEFFGEEDMKYMLGDEAFEDEIKSMKNISSYVECDNSILNWSDLNKLIDALEKESFNFLEVNEGVYMLNIH